jgi:hypothetical protein
MQWPNERAAIIAVKAELLTLHYWLLVVVVVVLRNVSIFDLGQRLAQCYSAQLNSALHGRVPWLQGAASG